MKSLAHFPPSFEVAAPGKIQDEEISDVPTSDPYLSPPSGTLPRRRLAGREGSLLSLTRHRCSDGCGTMLFELSVGLAGYTDMETPKNRFSSAMTGDSGSCRTAWVLVARWSTFFLTSTNLTTGQGGKLADRLNHLRGPLTSALTGVDPAFSHGIPEVKR